MTEPAVTILLREHRAAGVFFTLHAGARKFTYSDPDSVLTSAQELNLTVNRDSFLDELRRESGLDPLTVREPAQPSAGPDFVFPAGCSLENCRAFKYEDMKGSASEFCAKMNAVNIVTGAKKTDNCGLCDVVQMERIQAKWREERHKSEDSRANKQGSSANRAAKSVLGESTE